MLHRVEDSVARYCAAVEAGDVEAVMATLAPEPEVVSPISGRLVFRGREDVRILLAAVYASLNGQRWTRQLDDDGIHVALGEARVGPVRLTEAIVFELDSDGRIGRIRPHLRPWLGLTLFALALGPRVARHPGVVRRALAPDSSG
jgi:hypothetical protein